MKQVMLNVLFGALLALAGPASAISLSVSPGLQQVDPGGTFTVDIIASDLMVEQVISGYNLMLGYDASRMTAKSVLFGNALGGANAEDVLNSFVLDFDPRSLEGVPNYGSYSGTHDTVVSFFEMSLAAVTDYYATLSPLQVMQPFMLARITFEMSLDAPAGQSLVLDLMDDTAFTSPPAGGDFDVKGRTGSDILSATLQDGSVKVPTPGPLGLVVSVGLVGLLGRHWSRRSRRASAT